MSRWCWLVLLGGCSFEHGALERDSGTACTQPWWDAAYAHRYKVNAIAPSGYTLQFDVTPVLTQSLAGGNDVRVVVGDTTELDRILTSSLLEVKAPAEGAVYVYVGNAAPAAPHADPARVYLFAESFEGFATGDNVTSRFDAQPTTDWSVVDDGGNHIYHAEGTYRHPAAIKGMSLADGEIKARMRFGAYTGQQHNGLGARGSSMDIATMDGFVGELQGDSAHVRIAEYADGASGPPELAGQSFTIERARWYDLRMRFAGAHVSFTIDGTTTIDAMQGDSNGQHVGLFAHDCQVDYDDVRVRMYAEPEPAVTLGPDEPRCP